MRLQQQLAVLIIITLIILMLEQSPGLVWGRGTAAILPPVPPSQPSLAQIQELLPVLTFGCCLQLQFSDKNQLITFLKLAMK